MREVFPRLRHCRRVRLGVVALIGLITLLALAGGTHLFESPEKKAVRKWLTASSQLRDEVFIGGWATFTNALPDASLPLLVAELGRPVSAFNSLSRRVRTVLPHRVNGWIPDDRRAETERFLAVLLGLRGREGKPAVRQALLNIACDTHVRNRHVALNPLSWAGVFTGEEVERLERIVRDTNPKVRRAAARMLSYGGIRDERLRELAMVLYADADPTVRAAFGLECETDVLELE